MTTEFSTLEINILKSKGLTDAHLTKLQTTGVSGKSDFETIGDAQTLKGLIGIDLDVATAVMAWATGGGSATIASDRIVIESSDLVYCAYCKTKQPPDYESGNLCHACGKQAQPINNCYWCHASGPGKFCRKCGAEFVPLSEYELAVQLKRDGEPMTKIAALLRDMNSEQKEQLLSRSRR